MAIARSEMLFFAIRFPYDEEGRSSMVETAELFTPHCS
jgi:hypothetical protein